MNIKRIINNSFEINNNQKYLLIKEASKKYSTLQNPDKTKGMVPIVGAAMSGGLTLKQFSALVAERARDNYDFAKSISIIPPENCVVDITTLERRVIRKKGKYGGLNFTQVKFMDGWKDINQIGTSIVSEIDRPYSNVIIKWGLYIQIFPNYS